MKVTPAHSCCSSTSCGLVGLRAQRRRQQPVQPHALVAQRPQHQVVADIVQVAPLHRHHRVQAEADIPVQPRAQQLAQLIQRKRILERRTEPLELVAAQRDQARRCSFAVVASATTVTTARLCRDCSVRVCHECWGLWVALSGKCNWRSRVTDTGKAVKRRKNSMPQAIQATGDEAVKRIQALINPQRCLYLRPRQAPGPAPLRGPGPPTSAGARGRSRLSTCSWGLPRKTTCGLRQSRRARR